jgi:alpha-beta hydrolase superfamily lysophospholipase
MIPLAIPTSGGVCFAAYDWAPGRAVLLIPPFGMEAEASARIWRDFAAGLARSGIAVLRPDLPGTGDSAGDATEPGRVASWRAAIAGLHAWLAERHDGRVALVGCRFGALLALDAIALGVPADGLVLLDPPESGAVFARGLRARARLEGHGAAPDGPDFIQAYGVPIAAATLADLRDLPADFSPARRLPPVLAVVTPQRNAWPERLGNLGASVTEAPFEGHGEFVLRGPMHTTPPLAVFDRVQAFLHTLPSASAAPVPSLPAVSTGLAMPGLTEAPVSFGPGLFGILCRPDHQAPDAPVVVLPSTGNRPRSGMDGSWAVLARRLARLGIASLRYDTGGVGESNGETPAPGGVDAYLPQRVADMRAAIDRAAAEGNRVVLVGHCSGAYAAWQAAIDDGRVAGLLTINLLVLGRQTVESAQALLRPAVASIAPSATSPSFKARLRGMAVRLCPGWAWNLARSLGREERDARHGLRVLAARGCTVRFLYADAPGEDYRFCRAFGPAPRLPAGIGLTTIAGADHELSARRHRLAAFDMVAGFAASMADARTRQAARQPSHQEIAA